MRILFVDDEKSIREGIVEIINWKKVGCEKLMIAENGDEALKILQKETFDLVITDIYMQKINGIQLAKEISRYWPKTRVILLSAYENFSYAREAIEAGVAKYLLKPLTPEELESAILEVMQKKQKFYRSQEHFSETEKFVDICDSQFYGVEETKQILEKDTEDIVVQALEIIQKNFQREDLEVSEIATSLHVSTGYFSRIFKKRMGSTCIEYITKKRIERAKELLKHTEMKHYLIAQAVGYSNVYYFSVQFKKLTGETPGQYRKRMEEERV